MEEGVSFECDRRRLWSSLLVFLALATAVTLLTWSLREPRTGEPALPSPLPALLGTAYLVGWIIVALKWPKRYIFSGAVLLKVGLFHRSTVDLSKLNSPIAPKLRWGKRSQLAVYTRERIVFFYETTDEVRFAAHVLSALPAVEEYVLHMRTTYRGMRWMHLCAAAIFVFIPLSFIVSVLITLGTDVLRYLPRVLLLFSPFFVIAILYGMLALNVKVVRQGDRLTVFNILGLPVREWAAQADELVIGPLAGQRFVGRGGDLRMPQGIGGDRRLVYDVFAISSGKHKFTDSEQ